jgi:raffinose/stachyose/melibiose transport system substrate-binding protein
VKYEDGTNALNDATFVQAYTDFAQIAPYLPDGFASVTYNDSQALFNTAQAAMFVDGSWTISVYDDATFDWDVFPIPAREASKTAITFHIDAGVTMNNATKHPDEAKAFLEWLCTKEGAQTTAGFLPTGMFPAINAPITIEDKHANAFLALNTGRVTDVRFVWPKLMDLYAPMNQELIKLLKGEVTPQQAADAVNAAKPAG